MAYACYLFNPFTVGLMLFQLGIEKLAYNFMLYLENEHFFLNSFIVELGSGLGAGRTNPGTGSEI